MSNYGEHEAISRAVNRPVADITPTGFYLAAYHHGKTTGPVLWWGPGRNGFTPDLELAGVYSATDADELYDPVGAVPVPVAMVDGLRVRRVVDIADAENVAFRTPKELHAALVRATLFGERA